MRRRGPHWTRMVEVSASEIEQWTMIPHPLFRLSTGTEENTGCDGNYA